MIYIYSIIRRGRREEAELVPPLLSVFTAGERKAREIEDGRKALLRKFLL
jgi:hypothetical protein